MPRWLVQLQGERFDLDEFPYWFPDGDIHAVSEEDGVFLVGAAFDQLEDAEQVHNRALHVLDEFYGVIAVLDRQIGRPTIGTVYRVEAGQRKGFVFGSGMIQLGRAKLRGFGTVIGDAGTAVAADPETEAQKFLRASKANHRLETAVYVWADPVRTWPRLYRILEEIELHLRIRVDEAGLCSSNERQRFTRSANHARVAGRDARHADKGHPVPKNPLKLAEASSFIGAILEAALRQAAERCHEDDVPEPRPV